MNSSQVIILLGRSGSGKGTQAKLLQEKLGLEYVGSGDLLRERKKAQDFTGKKIGEVIDRGGFVPSVAIFKLWMDRWEELKKSGDLKGFIIDGSPRKLIEAHIMDQALQWYEWDKYLKIILVDLSRDDAFDRLSNRRICKDCGKFVPYIGEFKSMERCPECGGDFVKRADDTPDSINSRLDEFERETYPVIDYYEKDNRLVRINGNQSIEDVHKDIMEALEA